MNIRDKLISITIAVLVSAHSSNGQKTEISFNVYSGLFSFRGDGATSQSWIISYPFINPPTTYTVNPYGKSSAFSYEFELQGQRLSKRKNIYGLGLSFEMLASKVDIYKIGVSGDPAYLEYPANGETKLKNGFITVNPFAGHRISLRKTNFDLLAGFDLGFCLTSKEIGNANINDNGHVAAENDKAKPLIDFRPRIQIKMRVYKFGLLAGYSMGLTNYQPQNNSKTYAGFLRLGLSYQLR